MPNAQQGATQRNNQKNGDDDLGDYLFGHNELSQSQVAALELMLRGLSDAQVASELGVDRGTVFRWRKQPPFARALDHHRRLLLERSAARLQTLLDPALDILQKQLAGDDPKTQLRAAAILVRMATPSRMARPTAEKFARQEKKAADEEFDRRLDAYINAPMPGERVDAEDE